MKALVLSAIIVSLILLAASGSSQQYPPEYSTDAAYGVPQPMTPASPESLNIQIPISSGAASQAPPAGEASSELLMVGAAPPTKAVQSTGSTSAQLVLPPGTSNRLYISYAPETVEGCPLYGWLPMWIQTPSPGPIWIYEWYPGGRMDWKYLGNAGAGWNKRWFYGDTPGWHTLQYYCNGWSNYIYIYVYPAAPYVAPTPAPIYRTIVYYHGHGDWGPWGHDDDHGTPFPPGEPVPGPDPVPSPDDPNDGPVPPEPPMPGPDEPMPGSP